MTDTAGSTRIHRRRFLAGSAATAGGLTVGAAASGGPFAGLLAGPLAAAPQPTLGPVPDQRDGVVRLWLPPGFQYRSFHDTEQTVTLDDGTVLPGRHDGMAAFRGRRGTVVLVRNHEVNGPVPAFGDPSRAYDTMTGGGTTTVEVTGRGVVVGAFTSLNGTQMNCSGGRMPWGSWVTC
jgi:secreted PhoX family phosphatase